MSAMSLNRRMDLVSDLPELRNVVRQHLPSRRCPTDQVKIIARPGIGGHFLHDLLQNDQRDDPPHSTAICRPKWSACLVTGPWLLI